MAIALTIAMSFFMILAFVLAVSSAPLAALVAGMLGPLGGIGLMLGNWLIVLAAITFVIATIYHVCPDVDFPWRWFSPGSVIFTLGFARVDDRCSRSTSPTSPRTTRPTARSAP